MQSSNLVKIVGISVLSLSAAIAPLMPASAQVATPNVVTTPDGSVRVENRDDGFDWGWLGLLGLGGLAGLAGRKRQETTYRDPDATGRTTYRE